MHHEGETLLRRDLLECAVHEDAVGAQVYEAPLINDALNDLADLLVDERLAAGNVDDGCTAVLGGLQALFDGKALVEDVLVLLDAAASAAGQIAQLKRLKHQREGEHLLALQQVLLSDVGRHAKFE